MPLPNAINKAISDATGVAFVPLQEDYGFVTAEAFSSAKPVITTVDSGGPAELVHDGISGRVVPSTAAALGDAIAQVMSDAALAERMGQSALATAATMRWADVAAILGRPL